MLNTQSASYRYTQCKCYQMEDNSSHLDENEPPSDFFFHETTRMLMCCVSCNSQRCVNTAKRVHPSLPACQTSTALLLSGQSWFLVWIPFFTQLRLARRREYLWSTILSSICVPVFLKFESKSRIPLLKSVRVHFLSSNPSAMRFSITELKPQLLSGLTSCTVPIFQFTNLLQSQHLTQVYCIGRLGGSDVYLVVFICWLRCQCAWFFLLLLVLIASALWTITYFEEQPRQANPFGFNLISQ